MSKYQVFEANLPKFMDNDFSLVLIKHDEIGFFKRLNSMDGICTDFNISIEEIFDTFHSENMTDNYIIKYLKSKYDFKSGDVCVLKTNPAVVFFGENCSKNMEIFLMLVSEDIKNFHMKNLRKEMHMYFLTLSRENIMIVYNEISRKFDAETRIEEILKKEKCFSTKILPQGGVLVKSNNGENSVHQIINVKVKSPDEIFIEVYDYKKLEVTIKHRMELSQEHLLDSEVQRFISYWFNRNQIKLNVQGI